MRDDKLNDHTKRIACQTCHIPEFARGGISTKMSWDWSKAGKKNPSGRILIEKDEVGRVTYHTEKGRFVWQDNVVPSYLWSNGTIVHKRPGDKVDISGVVPITAYLGNADTPTSRIIPVKISRGMQPVDSVNQTLAIPNLMGEEDGAYWSEFKWQPALAIGMKAAGLPFSGEFTFVETRMDRAINHMVAPASNALICLDCHIPNGRMAGLKGIYLPGQESFSTLDKVALALLAATLLIILIHGLLRIVFRAKKWAQS